ncbi:MAG: deoxyribodipyrimidine photo-lyase, partial [Gammaproteobacteria bacterium]
MSLLIWFRRDLRVQDNPALWQVVQDAREQGQAVTALYVFDPEGVGAWPPGGASRWYLEQSLRSLQQALAQLGVPLRVERGRMTDWVPVATRRLGATGVYWNRLVEPGQAALDEAIAQSLR